MDEFSPLMAQAWHRQFVLRTCPSISVLKTASEAVQVHLRSCRECRETMKHLETYEQAGEWLVNMFPKRVTKPSEVQVGDIRRIKPTSKKEEWFDRRLKRFYNPPHVVIIGVNGDAVLVSQLFEEPDLAVMGEDLLIDDHLFAELWNCYTVPKYLLAEKSYRRVSEGTVYKLRKGFIQFNNISHENLDEDSPIYHFRLLEFSVGSFFALPHMINCFHK